MLLLFSEVAGQRENFSTLTFQELSIEQGLSQSIVFCILQDRNGFLWFGTEDGLNKYDGYHFTVLRHDPLDSNSLWYNDTRAVYEDKDGILWIGTFYGGLNRYDPASKQFTHFRHIPENPNSLSDNNVRAILEDRAGVLWIGTDGGLNRFDRETESFTRFQHEAGNPASLSHNIVNTIYEEANGTLWIGTNGGLDYLLSHDHGLSARFEHFQHDPANPRSLSTNLVNAIYQDRSGALWVGTPAGLHHLQHLNNSTTPPSFIRYQHDPRQPNSLSHNDVRVIYEDESGVLWIGTNGGGLNLLDRDRTTFIHYQNDAHNPASLSHNEVLAIREDRSGIIWLGTYGGGVNKVMNRQNFFATYRPDPNDPNSLPHEIVWAIHEDDDGILWIGTHGGGLTRYDRRKNQYTTFRHDPANPKSLSHNIVRLIHPARGDPDVLWVGTHGGGLNRFEIKKNQFTRYLHDPNNPTSISHNELRALYQDRSGTLWIGTNGGGLNQFIPDGNTNPHAVFTHYRYDAGDSTSLSNDFIRTIYKDPDAAGRVLWIGTQGGGLNKFDQRTGTFKHFRAVPGQRHSLNNDYIFCIHEDAAAMLWLGTWGGGLIKFDREQGAVGFYTTREGLPGNEIYGILEDAAGNFWMSSNKGLSRFNPSRETVRNYTVDDGLQSNEFNGGSFFKSKSGEMFFGGIHGFNAFFPQNLKDNQHRPPVTITGFFKFNKEVDVGQSLSTLKELHLFHKDYVFSFEFAALDFNAPMKNQYAYKMEGLDKEWIYTDASRRFATYTTLPAGTYIFRVKGSNNDGLWNEEGASIRVIIHPPVWKTWWFRAMLAALALGLAFVGYRQRLKTVRLKTELRAAHNAQMSIMPHADPQIAGFDISGVCTPANEVGGDFFDYFWLDDAKTKFGIAIGDVSGKAMQSAMTAVLTNGMIHSSLGERVSINEMMTKLNRPMYLKTERNMFTALCLALLDVTTRELKFTNAGLIEPLLKRAGSVVALQADGPTQPLGIIIDNVYQENAVQLKSGDALILATDGITEEQNSAKELYGEERLNKLLHQMNTASLSAKEIKDGILQAVKRFSGSSPQDDDMTVVVVKVL